MYLYLYFLRKKIAFWGVIFRSDDCNKLKSYNRKSNDFN